MIGHKPCKTPYHCLGIKLALSLSHGLQDDGGQGCSPPMLG